ncbi:hypothetical protein BUALT_Bualt07G0145400 [Buddleja alternifolia]|uniref:BHLH domain-containing protein n=1 Tax=Buddleja alternifolia TaxID=168488 RepID=A0AAV6XLA8_9LAMI|nr:hypothetical protein BUALT_Bualt07G0145400 [Buddleja alternifolia]
MMAGNPNWWSINNGMHPQSSSSNSSSQFVYGSSNPSHQADVHHHPNQDFPVRSWSQLLLGGGEEERFGASLFQQQKKLENWEEQVFLNLNPSNFTTRVNLPADVKQENDVAHPHSNNYNQLYNLDDEFQAANTHDSNSCNWPPPLHHHQVVSSPTSCITTLANNSLNFSGGKAAAAERKNNHHNQDHSAEVKTREINNYKKKKKDYTYICIDHLLLSNSTGTGGVSKKARVQQSSAQPALKVRKEKLGDRITALHQLVSPFGKTDTASVLSEAIGYIRFLQGQIEALSSPYMRNAAGSTGHQQHSVQERNCLFPEEPNQFLNDMGMEGRGASKQITGLRRLLAAAFDFPVDFAAGGGLAVTSKAVILQHSA